MSKLPSPIGQEPINLPPPPPPPQSQPYRAPAAPGPTIPAPTMPAPAASGLLGPGKHKVHHSYVWMQSITIAFSLVAVLFFTVIPMVFGRAFVGSDTPTTFGILVLVLVGGLVLLAFLITAQILGYRHLAFEFTDSEFNLYSGIITKKRVHVPYQRVQSVNHNATLVQRIIGVCSVSIETAGGASNKAIRVPYVQNVVAEQIRSQLFVRKEAILRQEAEKQAAQKTNQAVGQTIGQVAHQAGDRATNQMASQKTKTSTTVLPPPSAATPFNFPAPAKVAAPTPGSLPFYFPPPAITPTPTPANVLDQTAASLATERGVFGGAAYNTGAISYECRLSNKELIFSAISNSSSAVAIVIAAIYTIIGFIGSEGASLIFDTLFGQNAYSLAGSFVESAIQKAMIPLIIGGVFLIAIIWVLGIVTTCFSYGGFHAVRRNNRIEVERGLIQHQFSGMDVERVQSVIIRQSFIRRCIGYCELSLGRIDSVDQAQDKGQQNNPAFKGLVIHPFVKLGRVPEIMAGLAPEYAGLPVQPVGLPKVALRRVIIRRCLWQCTGFWLALFAALIQVVTYVLLANGIIGQGNYSAALDALTAVINVIAIVCYVIYAILLVVNIISAVLWYKTSSFAYNRHFMTIKNGGLRTESVSFPRKKIQFGFLRSNPFQRHARVASIHVVTAAGIRGTSTKLMDVAAPDSEAWLNWLIPGGNRM